MVYHYSPPDDHFVLIPSYTPFSDTSMSSIHWLNRYSLCLNTQIDWLHKICIHMLPPKKSIVHHFSIFHWQKLAISSGFSLGNSTTSENSSVTASLCAVSSSRYATRRSKSCSCSATSMASRCGSVDVGHVRYVKHVTACVNSYMMCLMLIFVVI